MAERRDIELMDWLYEEAEPSESQRAAAADDLASLGEVRQAFRSLPDEEPPAALSAILLHEAARRAPARPRARAVTSADEESGWFIGAFAWLGRLFRPMASHPAAAALATLVLVAGVAGTLYIRGERPVEPEARSAVAPAAPEEEAPAATEAAEPEARPEPDEAQARLEAGRLAGLADEDEKVVIDEALEDLERGGEAEPGADRRLSDRRDRGGPRTAPRKKRPTEADGDLAANVISGADRLIDRDDDDATTTVVARQSKKGEEQEAQEQADPPPERRRAASGSSSGAEATARAASADLSWAREQKRHLDDVSEKDCRGAARIANDIRDRAPDFYREQVQGSKEVKRCARYVRNERERRAKRRAKPSSYDAAAESE